MSNDNQSATLIGSIGDLPDKLRARDVERRLRTSGAELHPAVMSVIAELAERTFHNDKALMELAVMFDQMIDTMHGFGNVAENMKKTINRFQRDNQDEEAIPDVTN
jgi:hypothetical protein